MSCNNPENWNKTGFNILNQNEEVGLRQGYIRTKWYPSLNEGNIELLSQYLQNTGCTKIYTKNISVTYVVTDVNSSSIKKILNFPNGEIFDGEVSYSSIGEVYPSDFQLFRVVFFEDMESKSIDLAKFHNKGPYLISTIIAYNKQVILKDDFTVNLS